MSKIFGLDAADRVPEIVFGHDVVPFEHCSGAVTRHAHHNRFWNAQPARTRDEAASQVVEPNPVQSPRFAGSVEGFADVLPSFAGAWISELSSLAAFEVTAYGRFWVTAEAQVT